MAARKFVAVSCTLSPGMFTSELVVAVKMADGQMHHGIVPRHFCWNQGGKLVEENEVTGEVEGWVAARTVDEVDLPGDQVAIEVPDGEVVAVWQHQIAARPTV